MKTIINDRKRRIISLVILSLMIVIFLPMISNNSEAGSPLYADPVIEVTLDSDSYMSKDHESHYGHTVIVTGSVKCQIPEDTPPYIEVRVTLTFYKYSSERFMGEVELDFFKDGPEVLAFEMVDHIDESHIAGTIIPVKISGEWNYRAIESDPEDLRNRFCEVVVGEHGRIEMKTIEDLEIQRFAVGELYQFDIQVISYGNGPFLCDFYVVDAPINVQVEVLNGSLQIPPYGYKMLNIQMKQVKGEAISDKITIRCAVVIGGSTSTYTIDLPFTTYETNDEVEMKAQSYYWYIGGGFLILFSIVMIVFLIRLNALKRKKRTDEIYEQGYYETQEENY